MPTIPNGYRQVASGRLVFLRPNYNRPLVNAKDFSKIKKRYNVNDTLLQKAISDNPSIELFLKRYPDAAPVFSQFVPRPQKLKIISQLESVVPSDEASNIEFLKRAVDTFPMSFPVISAESMMSQLTPSEADLFKSQGVIGLLNSASAGGSSLEEAIRELTQTLRERGVPPDSISSISDAVSSSSSKASSMVPGRTLTPAVRMSERQPEDEGLRKDRMDEGLATLHDSRAKPMTRFDRIYERRRIEEGLKDRRDEGLATLEPSRARPRVRVMMDDDKDMIAEERQVEEGLMDRWTDVRTDDGLPEFLQKEFVKSKAEEPKFEELATAVDDLLIPSVLRGMTTPAATPVPSSRRRGEDDRDGDGDRDSGGDGGGDGGGGDSGKSAEKASDSDRGKSAEKASDEDADRVPLLDLAKRLYAAYNPLKGRVKAKTDPKVLEMRDEFIDELYDFMTSPGSGRAELTPSQAKQLYDIVERGVPFPRNKLSKRRPILDKLMKITP